jgi:large subunit ribosomal protein L25
MTEQLALSAKKRLDVGKGASRRLRKEEVIPGVLYGKHITPISLQFEHRHLLRLIKDKSCFSNLINLDVEGESYNVLIKDMQRHVYKNKVMHLDLQALSSEDVVLAEIPLEFINTDKAVGVKKGGALSITMKTIRVRCLSINIPANIVVDVAALDLEQVLHLSDIILPAGAESYDLILGKDHNHPVVAIHSVKTDAPGKKD